MGPMFIGTSRGYRQLIGKALPPPLPKTGESHGLRALARGRVPVRFFLPSLYMSGIEIFRTSLLLTVVICAGEMDSDLDALIDNAGAKRSKRPRAGGLKTGQPGKSSKRSRKTPPPAPLASSSAAPTTMPPSQAVVPTVAPASLSGAPVVVESHPPIMGQTSSAQLPTRPSASRAQKLTISTHMDSYVVDNSAGSHGSTLISDVMSRIGQSYGSFEAPQWQCITGARDRTALYEKSIEHTAAVSIFPYSLFISILSRS